MKGRGVRVISDTDFQAVTPDAQEQDALRHRGLRRRVRAGDDRHQAAGAQADRLASRSCSRRSRSAAPTRTCSRRWRAGWRGWTGRSATRTGRRSPRRPADDARGRRGRAGGRAGPGPPDRRCARGGRPAAGCRADRGAGPPAGRGLLRGGRAAGREPGSRRRLLIETKQRYEQTIDTVSKDEVLEAGYSEAARERAGEMVAVVRAVPPRAQGRDRRAPGPLQPAVPGAAALRGIKALAEAIKAPPRSWTPEALWRAYETLDRRRCGARAGRS